MSKEAKVHHLPPCDFEELNEDTPCSGTGMFDFKTQQGPWANGCNAHYRKHRLYQELGTGMGQRLVLAEQG